jgi:hypothetical protein
LFRQAEREFLAACPPESPLRQGADAPLAIGIRMSGTPATIARFRRELLALAKRLSSRSVPADGAPGLVTAAGLLVFHLVANRGPSPAKRRRS